MPQARTKSITKVDPSPAKTATTATPPTSSEVHELISKMLEYEETSKKVWTDPSSSRFAMLTKAEREFYRAELIGDYIRLSIGNIGNTPGYYEATLRGFCAKICDMAVPSIELVGTYLAAVEIVDTTRRYSRIPLFKEAVRRTMLAVLQGCVALMDERNPKAKPAA